MQQCIECGGALKTHIRTSVVNVITMHGFQRGISIVKRCNCSSQHTPPCRARRFFVDHYSTVSAEHQLHSDQLVESTDTNVYYLNEVIDTVGYLQLRENWFISRTAARLWGTSIPYRTVSTHTAVQESFLDAFGSPESADPRPAHESAMLSGNLFCRAFILDRLLLLKKYECALSSDENEDELPLVVRIGLLPRTGRVPRTASEKRWKQVLCSYVRTAFGCGSTTAYNIVNSMTCCRDGWTQSLRTANKVVRWYDSFYFAYEFVHLCLLTQTRAGLSGATLHQRNRQQSAECVQSTPTFSESMSRRWLREG